MKARDNMICEIKAITTTTRKQAILCKHGTWYLCDECGNALRDSNDLRSMHGDMLKDPLRVDWLCQPCWNAAMDAAFPSAPVAESRAVRSQRSTTLAPGALPTKPDGLISCAHCGVLDGLVHRNHCPDDYRRCDGCGVGDGERHRSDCSELKPTGGHPRGDRGASEAGCY